MTELEKLCENALYEEVHALEDKRSIVRDNASGRLFYRKRLDTYNPDVFNWLKTHRSRYVPRIEAFWQDGEELVVIEELIQGETLEEILERAEKGGDLPFQERIRILTELCDGLSFLHSADPPIIHRDLKPSNIMLTEDGVVKIIDYDAAKLFVEGQKRDTQLIGTQGTAAPEQYGFAASDARTDIYALGKLIERMLPDNVDAARIVNRATSMDPAGRYADAAQIREQIRRIREKASGLDIIFGRIPGYNPVSRKHRALARLSIPVLCVILLGLAAFLYQTQVALPRKQQQQMQALMDNLSCGQMAVEETTLKCEELLRQWPYDSMNAGQQKQFCEMAQTVVRRCSSNDAGQQQETGVFLSDEGKDFLTVLRRSGMTEETVKSISIGGQLQFLIRHENWEKAVNGLKYLKGLPNESEIRENVFEACMASADKEAQNFQEKVTILRASHALADYSLLIAEGYEAAEASFTSFYDIVLTEADAQREGGHFSMAKELYEKLLEYDQVLPEITPAPPIDVRIMENEYRKGRKELEEGHYTKAREVFKKLGTFKDAEQQTKEAYYLEAQEALSGEEYDKAVTLFEIIPGYKEADGKLLEAEYAYCASVMEAPDDKAYRYLEQLIAAGYPDADAIRDKIYTMHARIDTGINYLVGHEQSANIRATLFGGRPDESTHIRFDLYDHEAGRSYSWTSDETYTRGQNCISAYSVSSSTEYIFEKEYTVNVYADDGTKLGSWSGRFSEDFLD